MRAEHVLGPLGLGGDFVNVEVGGVRGEDRAGLGDRIEPFEHALLDLHVLEHRFDHESASASAPKSSVGESLPIRSSTSGMVSRPFLAVAS